MVLTRHQDSPFPPASEESKAVFVRPSALEINEVLSLIFSFLSQKTLRHVVGRVCHKWFVIAKRCIQYHADLDPLNPKSWKDLSKKLVLASNITVGKSIAIGQRYLKETSQLGLREKPWTLLIQTLMEIDQRSNEQEDSSSRSSSVNKGLKQQKLQVKSLELHLEPWWIDPVPTLRLFNPLGLRDLKINVPSRDGRVDLGFFLNQCPNLWRLELSTRVLYRGRQGNILSGVLLPSDSINNNTGDNARTRHPLRFLRLEQMEISPNALITYLQRLGQLVGLSLVDIDSPAMLDDQHRDSFQQDEANDVFWKSLATSCPCLELIRFNLSQPRSWAVPTALFPKVHQWGFYGGYITDPQSWAKVAVQENRVTRLELLGAHWVNESSAAANFRNECLYLFLCSSPLLLHLNTGASVLSLNHVFWGVDRPKDLKIWACRGLKTLNMECRYSRYNRFNDSVYSWSAQLFGYLGRVCPALEDLSLSVGYQVWPLMKGFCLLTRLHQLRRLELRTTGAYSSDQEPFQREDFAWIQGCTHQGSQSPPASSSTSFSSSLSSSISGLMSLIQRRVRPQSVDDGLFDWGFAYDDYQFCLNKMRTRTILHSHTGDTLYNPYDVELDRSRIRHQQRLNDYRNDYNNGHGPGPQSDIALPMVDGLRDFTMYGTFLDIEACLEARVFRLQESLREIQELEHQEQEPIQLIIGQSAKEIARASQPWPELEQFKLTHVYPVQTPHDKIHHNNLGRAFRYMKELRPDIDFQYQSSVNDF